MIASCMASAGRVARRERSSDSLMLRHCNAMRGARWRPRSSRQLLGVIPGAKLGPLRHGRTVSRSTVSLRLVLVSASDPISGSLVYADGRQVDFTGWIELTAAVEDARRAEPSDVVAHAKESASARPLRPDARRR